MNPKFSIGSVAEIGGIRYRVAGYGRDAFSLWFVRFEKIEGASNAPKELKAYCKQLETLI